MSNNDFCNVVMSYQNTNILELNQYQQPNKAPFAIYADLESVIEKNDGCKNIP